MKRVGITEERMMTDARTDSLSYGDIVSIYIDEKRTFVIRLVRGGILGTDKGFIKHEHIVGKSFGEIVYTSRGAKAYIMPPILIDKLRLLKRTTQVIYPKDLSFMIYLSGIRPGSRVLEAGVGTGFLTISLANFVGPNGRIYGFDLNEGRIRILGEAMEILGYKDRVVLKVGDIRKPLDLRGLDAVFLDIPDPWNALQTIYEVLKPGFPVIMYVPTVNQLEKTVIALREHRGFLSVHAYELLLREYDVSKGATRPQTLMIGHTGYIVYARKVCCEK